jgi:hypothetical protein
VASNGVKVYTDFCDDGIKFDEMDICFRLSLYKYAYKTLDFRSVREFNCPFPVEKYTNVKTLFWCFTVTCDARCTCLYCIRRSWYAFYIPLAVARHAVNTALNTYVIIHL